MKHDVPKHLIDVTRYFADKDVCNDFVASMRWPDGVVCPYCECKRVSFLKSRRIWKCMDRDCHKQFSVKTGSVFEDSPIPLDKWMVAVWLVVNCKNGISSYELHRDLDVTQKSAWFMLHRIRLALRNTSWEKMGNGGPVEVDEAYIGGKPGNRHMSKRPKPNMVMNEFGFMVRSNKLPRGRRTDKIPVFGILDRETRKVRAQVIPQVKREVLMNAILDGVKPGATVYSDSLGDYKQLKGMGFIHASVNHVREYVRGEVHSNGIENFWSLLKRGLHGTYVAVEPFHLERYVDEQMFRFNNRATKDNPLDDRDRFMLAVSQIADKRLTYKELTGKVGETETF